MPPAMTHHALSYFAPCALTTGIPPSALESPPLSCNMDKDCVICHEKLSSDRCSALAQCQHVFHYDCIQLAFKFKPQCAICRVAIGKPQGTSPSGTLEVLTSPDSCAGFQEGSIVIKYTIYSGTQLSYHESPGERHQGKAVRAYLPDTGDGQDLLQRLKFAFMHGLTFRVGTSLTTGKTNVVTWASIHHKTSMYGGITRHGWPDQSYFSNANLELDGLGVPPAKLLEKNGVQTK